MLRHAHPQHHTPAPSKSMNRVPCMFQCDHSGRGHAVKARARVQPVLAPQLIASDRLSPPNIAAQQPTAADPAGWRRGWVGLPAKIDGREWAKCGQSRRAASRKEHGTGSSRPLGGVA